MKGQAATAPAANAPLSTGCGTEKPCLTPLSSSIVAFDQIAQCRSGLAGIDKKGWIKGMIPPALMDRDAV
jgi:hypothetical protein